MSGGFKGFPPDHPHVRGEKENVGGVQGVPPGSSPRAWGKVLVRLFKLRFIRIIPTCVGKRANWQASSAGEPDHPHVRGEKNTPIPPMRMLTGSSPRAWGKAHAP